MPSTPSSTTPLTTMTEDELPDNVPPPEDEEDRREEEHKDKAKREEIRTECLQECFAMAVVEGRIDIMDFLYTRFPKIMQTLIQDHIDLLCKEGVKSKHTPSLEKLLSLAKELLPPERVEEALQKSQEEEKN